MLKKYLKQLSMPESYISITLGFLVVIVAGLLAYNYFSKTKPEAQIQNEKPTEEPKIQEISSLPTAYTVGDNENLWTIAEKYYHSGYNWVTIASENKLANPNFITSGQVLIIPKAETIRPEGNIMATAIEPVKTYSVVKDDNLWNIAVREYGDGFAWVKIAQANSLVNPNLIHAGNVLILPR